MTLEICANSLQSAINTQKAGAHRIELCSELSLGGITPSYGLIKEVVKALHIPVFVLIRPRSGNFCYSEAEINQMKEDITICKTLGCAGIVSGVLNPDNNINIEATKKLVKASKPLEFTFHRAFDCVPNPFKSLEQLIDIGVQRVLSSGKQPKAINGIQLLEKLEEKSKEKLIILPGSGINSSNISNFKRFKEVHCSASKIISKEDSILFGNVTQTESSIQNIKDLLKHI